VCQFNLQRKHHSYFFSPCYALCLGQADFPIPFPRESNQVIIEIIFSHNLTFNMVKSLNRCRGALEAISLSDITKADGRYLEHFIFDPGGKNKLVTL
jgi:hypothetical protein